MPLLSLGLHIGDIDADSIVGVGGSSETFTSGSLSATDSNATGTNNTYTLTFRPSVAIVAGSSIAITGLTGSSTGDNSNLGIAGANSALFGSAGAWTQSSGILVLTIASGQSVPSGSDTTITFVLANPNLASNGVTNITLISSGFSSQSLPGTFLNAIAIFNVTTRNTEANILASTPTNPTDEVNIAFGTDTGDFYIYNGSAWYIYNDYFQNINSVEFDGTDDYLDLSSLDSTISSIGAGDVSISMWVKFDSSIPSFSGFLHFGNADAFSNYFYCRYNTGSVEFQSREGTSGIANILTSVSKNVWYNLVFIRSGTTATLYVNNSSSSVTNAEFGVDFSNNTNNFMRVGSNRTNTQAGMVLVDEVAVFDSALSASDISSIYNNGSPKHIGSFNPVGWWRMGDGTEAGSGTTVYDMSINANNGTLTNGPTFSTTVPS
jgi:hypothetical protein